MSNYYNLYKENHVIVITFLSEVCSRITCTLKKTNVFSSLLICSFQISNESLLSWANQVMIFSATINSLLLVSSGKPSRGPWKISRTLLKSTKMLLMRSLVTKWMLKTFKRFVISLRINRSILILPSNDV